MYKYINNYRGIYIVIATPVHVAGYETTVGICNFFSIIHSKCPLASLPSFYPALELLIVLYLVG